MIDVETNCGHGYPGPWAVHLTAVFFHSSTRCETLPLVITIPWFCAFLCMRTEWVSFASKSQAARVYRPFTEDEKLACREPIAAARVRGGMIGRRHTVCAALLLIAPTRLRNNSAPG